MATAKDSKISKKEAVRRTLEKVGKDVKVGDALAHVKSEFGLEISPAHFFNIKSTLKGGGRRGRKRGRPGRPRKDAAAATAAAPVAATPRSNGVVGSIGLGDIQTVKALADRYGSENLHQLIKVIAK